MMFQATTKPQIQQGDLLVDVLRQSIRELDARREEQLALAEQFRSALAIVADLNKVNSLIAASNRPELKLTERAQQLQIDNLDDLKRLNNFKPRMRGFGFPTFEEIEGRKVFCGRRIPTKEELGVYFLMGARGDFSAHMKFAAKNGVSKNIAEDMFYNSLVDESAFMRMWIVVPELTQGLMLKLLQRTYPQIDQNDREEMFTAYGVMSKLVDKADREVCNSSGIDSWSLCR